MEEYLNKFIMVIIGLAATGVVSFIVMVIKWPFSIKKNIDDIKKNVDNMVENGQLRAEENRIQFQMLRAYGKATRTTLEVVAKNINNGNVDKAFKSLDDADHTYDEYAEKKIGVYRNKEMQK